MSGCSYCRWMVFQDDEDMPQCCSPKNEASKDCLALKYGGECSKGEWFELKPDMTVKQMQEEERQANSCPF